MDAALLSRIDLPQLSQHSDDHHLRHILKRYLESADDCLAQMEYAAKTKSILSWNHALQEMKSASHSITARRLAGLCTEAEIIRALPHEQAQALLYHMRKELVILQRSVKHLVNGQ